MSYTIFGDKGSGAFSAEAALAEAGAPYAFHAVSLKKNEQKKPEFLALNPSGKVPALRLPQGEVMTESAAILLAIAAALNPLTCSLSKEHAICVFRAP
ncbi:MAG TPA: glutathione S-transferase N-terminal domain-containing protein [Candidatus Udaeobacter sp.]|nr:glutathione S-transferase N-terminal domain-containing protein [Candidatus Udaeobacter sp.]